MNVLAVDGGGTKTALAVVDQDGRVLYRAAGGGINPFDQSDWVRDLRALLDAVGQPYGAAALALPGYGEAEVVTVQQHGVAASLGVPHAVLNDVDAAQLGAFAGGPGLLILAGTGSMVWGRDAAGTTLRVGGWGDLLGDEGSAYWTGLRALNGLTRALDGRISRTPLHDRLLGALQHIEETNSDDSLLSWLVGLIRIPLNSLTHRENAAGLIHTRNPYSFLLASARISSFVQTIQSESVSGTRAPRSRGWRGRLISGPRRAIPTPPAC